MKTIINFTIFEEDPQLMEQMIKYYIPNVFKQLNYTLIKYVGGFHQEHCARPHHHVMCVADSNDIENQKRICPRTKKVKKYIYKDLGRTIHNLKESYQADTPTLLNRLTPIKINISSIWEGETKKYKRATIHYDESVLGYPLKEYSSKNHINEKFCRGLHMEELEILRKVANIKWQSVKREINRQLEQEIQDKDEYQNMKIYVIDHMKEWDITPNTNYEAKVSNAMTALWKYKIKQNKAGKCKSVRVSSVQDQAVSILAFEGYLQPNEIVQATIKL
jgi:hypothetical protein